MTEKAEKDLIEICDIIGNTVKTDKIYLFGSHAYGTPSNDSDYDICIVIPDSSIRPVDAIKAIRKALYKTQTVPLDILVYRNSNFANRQEIPSLERKIAREGVLLYERKLIS